MSLFFLFFPPDTGSSGRDAGLSCDSFMSSPNCSESDDGNVSVVKSMHSRSLESRSGKSRLLARWPREVAICFFGVGSCFRLGRGLRIPVDDQTELSGQVGRVSCLLVSRFTWVSGWSERCLVDAGVRSCCCGLETRLGFFDLTLDVRRAMVSSTSITWSVSRKAVLVRPKPFDLFGAGWVGNGPSSRSSLASDSTSCASGS